MKVLQLVEQLFSEYGYIVLLIGLPLDAIALPIPPGNTTLTYAGYLSYKGVLDPLPALVSAYIGASLGVTFTYLLGYNLGMPLVERYGKWIFLKSKHIDKTKESYLRFGNRMLFFSYFMPGVRQFNGYFAGLIRIPFRTFALYAYTGAAAWVLVFFGVGYIFGNQWQFVFKLVERFFLYFFIGLGCFIIIFLFVKRFKKRNTF